MRLIDHNTARVNKLFVSLFKFFFSYYSGVWAQLLPLYFVLLETHNHRSRVSRRMFTPQLTNQGLPGAAFPN
jgi:hypothetical protein